MEGGVQAPSLAGRPSRVAVILTEGQASYKVPDNCWSYSLGDRHFREFLSGILCGAAQNPHRFSQLRSHLLLRAGMAENTAAEHPLFTGASCVLVFLSCLGSTLCADVHSLSCNLIIRAPTKAEPLWYEGQCSMDGNVFLSSNNVNKTMPLGNQEKMANATEVWKCVTQWIDLLGQDLRDKVSEIKVHTPKTSGHPTLWVTMLSNHSHGQIISASWELNISENYSFILDLKTMKWKLINPVPEDIMKEWKDDKTLMKHLNLFIVECSPKFNEFLNQHEERTRSTTRAPDITQPPPTSQVPYKEVLIPVGLIISIIFIIFICICVKRMCCPQGGRELQLLKDYCINCHKPQRNEGLEETKGEVPNQRTKMLSQEEDPKTLGGPRRASESVELELQMFSSTGS
ncbi:retinoic acid early-inducible protein 1-gamma-like [Rattus norvegicus]|nr:retinoic acid early-inducible protein 1-gamma-like [Rattus norvegicus]